MQCRNSPPVRSGSLIRSGRRALRSMRKKQSFINGNSSKPRVVLITSAWLRVRKMDSAKAGSSLILMRTNGWMLHHGFMRSIPTRNLPPSWIHSSHSYRAPRCQMDTSSHTTSCIFRINAGSICKSNMNCIVTDISSKRVFHIMKPQVEEI